MRDRRRGDHNDLRTRLVEHLLPASVNAGDAVAIRDRLRARPVALTPGDDLAAAGLKRGDVGGAYRRPMTPTVGSCALMAALYGRAMQAGYSPRTRLLRS